MIERKISDLTKREREVLLHVSMGKTNIEIARELHISAATVENHLTNIYRKWVVSNRTEAARYAFGNGLAA